MMLEFMLIDITNLPQATMIPIQLAVQFVISRGTDMPVAADSTYDNGIKVHGCWKSMLGLVLMYFLRLMSTVSYQVFG